MIPVFKLGKLAQAMTPDIQERGFRVERSKIKVRVRITVVFFIAGLPGHELNRHNNFF